MAEGVLPPAIQSFVADARLWVEGIDAMITVNDALLAQIEELKAAGATFGEGGMLAGVNAGEITASADAMNLLADAQARVAETSKGAYEGTAATAKAVQSVSRSTLLANKRLADFALAQDEAAAASKRAAGSIGAAGDAAAIAGTKAEVAGAKAATAGKRANAGAGMWAAAGHKAKLAFAGLLIGMGFAIDEAGKFQAAMERLTTQAGVSQGKIAGLSRGVLQLAGEVGMGPTSLAESLFHVESNFSSMGITSSKALSLVKIAAEGARVGGADLVDVTNALTGAVASNIPGVQDFSKAMGVLNKIVGEGDMSMQDLADAFSGGLLASVKSYGLSIKDVGAGLDVFGDNNMRGAHAATVLRMAVQSLAAPSTGPAATDALKKLGMTTSTLRDDMTKGGLLPALQDLKAKLKAAGYSAKTSGSILTDLFTKKAGVGLNILLNNMDRLRSKYPRLSEGANEFATAWQRTQNTVSQQFANFKEGLMSLAISFGSVLLPPAIKVLHAINTGFQWIQKHPVIRNLTGAIVACAIAAAGLGAIVTGMAGALEVLASPITAIVIGIAAIVAGVIYAYNHFKPFHDIVLAIGRALRTAFGAVMNVLRPVFTWLNAHPVFRNLAIAVTAATIAFGPIGGTIVAVGAAFVFLYQKCKAFRDLIANVGHFFAAIWHMAMNAASQAIHGFVSGPLAFIKQEIAQFKQWWGSHSREIKQVWGNAWRAIKTIVSIAIIALDAVIKPFLTMIETEFKVAWTIIRYATVMAWHTIRDVIRTVINVIEDIIGVVLDVITGHWSKAWQDLKKLAMDGLNGVKSIIMDGVKDFASLLYNAGRSLLQGLINGIKSMLGAVTGVVSGVAGKIAGFFGLSPAKWGPLSGKGAPEVRGRHLAEDLAKGIREGTGTAAAAAGGLAGILPGVGSGARALSGGSAAGRSYSLGGGGGGYSGGGGGGYGGGGGGHQTVNVYMHLNGAGSAAWQQGLQRAVHKAILDYALRNSSSGLIFPTRNR